MKLGRVVVVTVCIARVAHSDPAIEGHVSLGIRTSSTSESHYDPIYDETGSVRGAVSGLVGYRLGPTVIGVHAGFATPLSFQSSPQFDSGEEVAETNSKIYPFDIGVGGQVDVGAGFWISAWVGATVSFTHATSPAQHINAIDFTGDIPAASWSDHTMSLGYGIGLGYDIVTTEYGRWGALVAFDSQGLAEIPLRDNSGDTRYDHEDFTTRSLTLGVALRY